MKDEHKSDSENIIEDLDDAESLEPKIDLCSEYVKFIIEKEKNKIVVKDEVKEVCIIKMLYLQKLWLLFSIIFVVFDKYEMLDRF